MRLRNTSQLAGFTRRADLPFFLRELCAAAYVHEPLLAPTPELLDAYRKRRGSWLDYERSFLRLLAERRIEERLSRALFAVPTALLCSEATAERCHRRLICAYLQTAWGDVAMTHL